MKNEQYLTLANLFGADPFETYLVALIDNIDDKIEENPEMDSETKKELLESKKYYLQVRETYREFKENK